MTVRLTAAQARALGLGGGAHPPAGTAVRRVAAGPQVADCHTCGTRLVGETAAARHNRDTHHARYAIPLETAP